MNIYDYYIKFTINNASSKESASYLNKILYVSLIKESPTEPKDLSLSERCFVLYSKEDLTKVPWLSLDESTIIEKAFDLGLPSLYLKGVKDPSLEEEDELLLNEFFLNDTIYDSEKLAFTLIVSQSLGVLETPVGFGGVMVVSTVEIPTQIPSNNTVVVYDPSTDGKALGILTLFLNQNPFSNMQLKNIVGYKSIEPTGLVKTLKDLAITFIFNDGLNDLLGMFAAGGKAIIHPYIAELWRYNVRNELVNFLQVENPTYINSSILVIEDIINRVCDNFMSIGYFSDYKKTIAPLKEDQLASDVDSFLVNNVKVEYSTSGAIWGINLNIKE